MGAASLGGIGFLRVPAFAGFSLEPVGCDGP